MKNKRNVISVRFLITILIMAITISSAMVLVGCSDSGGSDSGSSSSSSSSSGPSTKDDTVAKPTATPAAGAVASGTTVTLATTTSGAEIWYTTNDATPAKNGAGSTKYTSGTTIITINAPTTIKAIAVKDGMTDSEILTAAYTLMTKLPTPTANPNGGEVAYGSTATLSCGNTSAVIRYTNNGTEPTETSTQYTTAITINPPMTIKAKAFLAGFIPSDTLTVTYPATGITEVNISITGPAAGATPATSVSSTSERFTAGTVTWKAGNTTLTGVFLGSTVYTATVTLTANNGFTFTGINNDNVKVDTVKATNITNNGTTLTLSHTFAATGKAVSSIEIKTQPTKLTGYTHGDALDLTGLEVTLTYSEGDPEDVVLADFGEKNITTSPANGRQLEYTEYNNKPVTISIGNASATTNNLSISKAAFLATNTKIVITGGFEENKTYTGSPLAQGFSISYQGAQSARVLTENEDFRVIYENNTDVGVATANIIGEKDFEGTITKNFNILKPVDNSTFVYAWVNAHGELVATSGDTSVKSGENLVFNADSSSDYTLVNWYVDGEIQSDATTKSFTFNSTIVGIHYVDVVLKKDDLLYNTTIKITVTDAE